MLASTSKVSMVVWVGNISGHQDLGRVWVKGGNANSVKFNIFRNTIASINKEYGGDAAFPKAPDALINGITQPVPSVIGQTVDQAISLLESLGLRVKVAEPRASAVEQGRVAVSTPGAGSRVSKGYLVTIYPSDGTLGAVMPDLSGNTADQATQTLKRRRLHEQSECRVEEGRHRERREPLHSDGRRIRRPGPPRRRTPR